MGEVSESGLKEDLVNKESEEKAFAEKRSSNIKKSVVVSLLSKVAFAITTLGVIPLAIATLGEEKYPIYAALAVLVGTMTLLNIGVGPGLVMEMSSVIHEKDQKKERQLLASAFFVVLGFVILLSAVGLGIAGFGSMTALFSDDFSQSQSIMRLGVVMLVAYGVLQSFAGVFASVVIGHLEDYRTKKANLYGYGLAALSTVIMLAVYPEPLAIIFTVYFVQVFPQYALYLKVFSRERKYLRFKWRDYQAGFAKRLLSLNLATSSFQLGEYLIAAFTVINIGHILGKQELASVQVAVQLFVMTFAVADTLMVPVWPSVRNAVSMGNTQWVARIVKRSFLILVGASVVLALGMGFLGPVVFPKIFDSFSMTQKECWLWALSLLLLMPERVGMNMNLAFSQVWHSGIIYIVKGVVFYSVVTVLPITSGPERFFVAFALVSPFSIIAFIWSNWTGWRKAKAIAAQGNPDSELPPAYSA